MTMGRCRCLWWYGDDDDKCINGDGMDGSGGGDDSDDWQNHLPVVWEMMVFSHGKELNEINYRLQYMCKSEF